MSQNYNCPSAIVAKHDGKGEIQMTKIAGTYEMSEWNEETLLNKEPPKKCTRVKAPGVFSGQMSGSGQTHYLINYVSEKTGPFTGYTFFEGKIGNRSGSFVLADEGIFDPEAATTKWTIVKGSGTNELKGISGTGGFRASTGLKMSFELDYELPD